jgi:hypothetical protein
MFLFSFSMLSGHQFIFVGGLGWLDFLVENSSIDRFAVDI